MCDDCESSESEQDQGQPLSEAEEDLIIPQLLAEHSRRMHRMTATPGSPIGVLRKSANAVEAATMLVRRRTSHLLDTRTC